MHGSVPKLESVNGVCLTDGTSPPAGIARQPEMSVLVHPKLEVNEDLDFQRRWWRLQRVGWAIMAVTLLAAGAGLLGKGPASHRAYSSESGRIQVASERFIRRFSSVKVNVSVLSPPDRPILLVSIPRPYLDAIEIIEVTPEPIQITAGLEHTTFEFQTESAGEQTWLGFKLEAKQSGKLAGEWTVDGESVAISHWVLP